MLIYLESLYVKENWFLSVSDRFSETFSFFKRISSNRNHERERQKKTETSARGKTSTLPRRLNSLRKRSFFRRPGLQPRREARRVRRLQPLKKAVAFLRSLLSLQ
jgi:hypothetical protein